MSAPAGTASHRLPRLAVRRQPLIDVAVAVVVFALTITVGPRDQLRDFDLLGLALAAGASLPLVARRRAPLAAFMVIAVANALLVARGYADQPPGPIVALYLLALRPREPDATTWRTDLAVVLAFFLHAAGWFEARDHYPSVPPPLTALYWAGAWVVGDRVRQRRERRAAAEEEARRARLDAERERRLAVVEERARLARELHDSAGHAINVILVQAGAARLLHERDPERSRAALETIEEVARETAHEIDQLVRGLREDDGAGGVEPPLGLAALDALAARHKAAGLDVSVTIQGTARALPAGVDRAAYRILQESLTNAARHGGGGAEVTVAYGADALELVVTNPLAGASPSPGGHGLLGMRERAALLGGRLEAGPGGGRFEVRAHLPYGDRRP